MMETGDRKSAKMSDSQRMMSECYSCIHKRSIPGDCHISCAKPDQGMMGNLHGIRNGWFLYPWNFDPVWKIKLCSNFEVGK